MGATKRGMPEGSGLDSFSKTKFVFVMPSSSMHVLERPVLSIYRDLALIIDSLVAQ